MSSVNLISQIDEAFAKGNNLDGLELLRRHVQSQPEDGGSWHRLANIEEQLGDWDKAGAAHFYCIQAAPANPLGYLYAGYWLQQSKNPDAAAAAYSLAQEADPSCLQLWRSNTTAQPTAIRSQAANTLLRGYLSGQHRELFSDEDSNSRVARAKWVRTHDMPVSYPSKELAPELFFIPDLQQKPWFERHEFDWSSRLESQADTIADELHCALQESPEQLGIRPYLPEDTKVDGKMAALAGSSNWSAIDLYRDGELNTRAAGIFPRTLDIIASLPTYGLEQQPFEVFFSMLQPHWSIDDHYGLSNHSLTCHIGLDVPEDCYLQVAGERRNWQQGKLLAFDDSYLHSAHNPSQARRIVLIFSIWHPSLNSQERADVQKAFKVRQQWMMSRRDRLQQLLRSTDPD